MSSWYVAKELIHACAESEKVLKKSLDDYRDVLYRTVKCASETQLHLQTLEHRCLLTQRICEKQPDYVVQETLKSNINLLVGLKNQYIALEAVLDALKKSEIVQQFPNGVGVPPPQDSKQEDETKQTDETKQPDIQLQNTCESTPQTLQTLQTLPPPQPPQPPQTTHEITKQSLKTKPIETQEKTTKTA